MRELSIPVLVLFFGCAGAAWAQGLSESDRDVLAAQFPGSERIALATGQLSRSSADISRAAVRMSDEKSCAMDRELIGLGAALQSASDALKRLEPMLLKQAQVSVGALLNPTPTETQALLANYQRQKTYREALDGIARAGKDLASLDPIGAAGRRRKPAP